MFEKTVPTTELAKVKTFLSEKNASGGSGMLRYRMGDVFAAVTRMMLSGDVPESCASERHEYLAFRPDILDVAIRELGRCVTWKSCSLTEGNRTCSSKCEEMNV